MNVDNNIWHQDFTLESLSLLASKNQQPSFKQGCWFLRRAFILRYNGQ
jgi:hypothetical protein